MLRLKVSFEHYSKKMQNSHMNRIVLSINLNQIITIKDLKNLINKEILSYGQIDNLLLKDDYLLLDSSKAKDILKNDDEIMATLSKCYNKKISFISCKDKKFIQKDEQEKIQNIDKVSSMSDDSNSDYNDNLSKPKVTKFLQSKTERKQSLSSSSNNNEEDFKDYRYSNNKTQTQPNTTIESIKKKEEPSISKSDHQNTQPKPLHSKPIIASQNNIKKNKQQNQIIRKENIERKDIDINNFMLIPCDKLDNIDFLFTTYPQLFQKDTIIKMKIHELLPLGPGVGDYKIGKLVQYSNDYHSFLIQLIQAPNLPYSLSSMYDYDLEANIISVQLKNFVELWIFNTSITQNNPIINQKNSSDNKELIVLPFLKRQVEYYFSDRNYYKDAFLQQKAEIDPDQCIIPYITLTSH